MSVNISDRLARLRDIYFTVTSADVLEEELDNEIRDAIFDIINELDPDKGNASILVEFDATELFDDEGDPSINWHYCIKHATFTHREACEFILHIGTDKGRDAYWPRKIEEMRAFGCTQEFIDAYLKAKDMGAVRVLFYA